MYVIWVVGAKPASRMSSIIRRRNGDMRRSFVDVEPPWSDPTKGYRIVPHARPKRFLGGAVSSTQRRGLHLPSLVPVQPQERPRPICCTLDSRHGVVEAFGRVE